LIHAIEQPDQPAGVMLEDLRLDPAAALRSEYCPDLLDGVTVLHAAGSVAPEPADTPYRRYGVPGPQSRPIPLTLVPYYAWANRGPHAMRVWIPTT